jgi:hypothetical protein
MPRASCARAQRPAHQTIWRNFDRQPSSFRSDGGWFDLADQAVMNLDPVGDGPKVDLSERALTRFDVVDGARSRHRSAIG